MDHLSLNTSKSIKYGFASFHHYSSVSNLNNHHHNSIVKKNDATSSEILECKDKFHKCNEGSIEVVSYEQFIKLLKSVELK